MSHRTFPHLFSPTAIGKVQLRNRSAISAHFSGLWVTNGLPNDDFAAYIEERARGGVGLFVIGATGVTYEGAGGFFHNTSDEIILKYRMLVAAGHRHGMKVFAQLLQIGDPELVQLSSRIRVGMQPREAITRRMPLRPDRPAAELRELAAQFGKAAGRAKAGGVDGLELHAHEGFFHAQFLSPLRNTRTDEYGGSLANRMRLLVQSLEAMRAAIGPDTPLGVRLKADDVESGGMHAPDYIEMIGRLEEMKLLDYVSLTAGDGAQHHGPMPRPDGEWISLVARAKQSTRLPIMHAGRITTPEMAEAALAEGSFDIVCLTKSHIADPHFTKKVETERLDDIRYCTRCLQKCIGDYLNMACVYNPLTSRERIWSRVEPASVPKRIVIVGAGPAGMEAALTAHQRGHEVIVLEKSTRAGGQVYLAAASPMRAMFGRIAEFYQRQADKQEFDIRFGTEATRDNILRLSPDAVIVATGSRPRAATIPGGGPTLDVSKLLTSRVQGLQSALVVDLIGTMHALLACDVLSERAASVRMISPMSQVAATIDGMTREEMLSRLEKRGVTFGEMEQLVFWDGTTAIVRHVATSIERAIAKLDAVVVSAGAESINTLTTELRDHVNEVFTIGDAGIPATVYEATLQGATIGRSL